ncbi:regulator of G protein signaling superfamily [Daldinia caldariorum]|uniref:regulator of G protein signaling superfamily n=1 Tax=Daldinia caldariorum TaxID=326644 RepID=UPI0020079CA6|nr:regulator of G protein signaling superfamily [Daldinia caldariorum]KAI1464158.1 regulator of G protein signaling superfamily [Daldinia caldariorum]
MAYSAALEEANQPISPPEATVRNRLPTLFEVLCRRTHPPVDLFSFYIYMRDQQRSVDYLDFWLDVAQHMSLCRHYVRELRRSVLVGTPDLETEESKRSSRILEAMGDLSGPARFNDEQGRDRDAQISTYLREQPAPGGIHDSPVSSLERRARASTQLSSGTPHHITDSNSPEHSVARRDIRASAEKILYTFLLPGAEREITLDGSIAAEITQAIEEDNRDDPELFDVAKDYVFQAMERDAFPGFLRARAFGNLVPPTLIARLIIGLIALFGAFWTGFNLIFLDRSRLERCWEILPFTIGVYFLASYQYSLDPIMALAGFSELTPLQFTRIREPYVRKLLIQRSLVVLAVTAIVDAALCVLFIFVPGHRL